MAGLFGGQSEQERGRVAVAVTLASGEVFNGHTFVLGASRLRDHINHSDRFLEFETRDGVMIFLAKATIASIAPVDLPRADQLQRRTRDLAAFEPHAILGVAKGAGQAEIRAAYWAKARAYHPDKIAGLDVPKEVADYMSACFVRIHAAYKELAGEGEPVPPSDASRRAAAAFQEFA